MSLNTGNNEPIRKDLLSKVVELLTKSHGCHILKPIRDLKGVYAFLMRHGSERFYLVVKGSEVWHGIVSCQNVMLSIAASEKASIVMAILEPTTDNVTFHKFDSTRVIENLEGLNERCGVIMANFPLSLSEMCGFQ